MKSRLTLFLITLWALPTISVYGDPVEVPNSETSIVLDGILTETEWSDAELVPFTAVNGETIDIKLQFDVAEDKLCFGVTIPDTSFDTYDLFFIYVDNDDDIESRAQPDDFLIGLCRDTGYSGNYKRNYEFAHIVGTGTGWDINNLLFDTRFLTAPFGKLDYIRIETGDSWGFEMTMSLDRDPVHKLGLAFKQKDVDGDSATLIYYPEDQPGAVNYPTSWFSAVIPTYTPIPLEETPVEIPVEQPDPEEPNAPIGIPGFPVGSLITGLSLILVLRRPEKCL